MWTHESHTHGYEDFGFGLNSTSQIEQFWGLLKSIIKKIYSIIPKNGIIYYIKEAEFRCHLSKKKQANKKKLFLSFLKKFLIYVLTIISQRMKLETIKIMIINYHILFI